MNILIIEDNLGYSTNAANTFIAAGHKVDTCESVAEWRRRIYPTRPNKPESGFYNNYDFSNMELYPYINEEEIDIVLTDLFLPQDGTNLGYKLQGNEAELPYGYIIALRYLAMGKKVAIVTAGELVTNEYTGKVIKTPDHHASPLMSVNDELLHLPNLVYHRNKNYEAALNNILDTIQNQ